MLIKKSLCLLQDISCGIGLINIILNDHVLHRTLRKNGQMTDKKTYLFIDTETTGFKKLGALIQDGQARVCQIAMILADEDQQILTQFSSLVKPDRWIISEGAYKCNGIDMGDCERYGMDFKTVVSAFHMIQRLATKTVAHNQVFDKGMVDIENSYSNFTTGRKEPWLCTMQPNAGIDGGKSLANCYKHWCGKELIGAHDAMVDTRACMEIFFAMRKAGHFA